jgi:glycogen debranching enzyme
MKESSTASNPQEVIQVNDRFYILATSPRVDEQTRVLKQGETFAVFDHVGDIRHAGLGEEGLFHEGTRFISRLRLSVNHRRPLLLNSRVRGDNLAMTVDLTNPDFHNNGDIALSRDTLYILRTTFLWNGVCYNRIDMRNFALVPVSVELALAFAADFVDIFEIRGIERKERGAMLPAKVGASAAELSYRGLDNVVRTSTLTFFPQPTELSDSSVVYHLTVQPQESQQIHFQVACDTGGGVQLLEFDEAVRALAASGAALRQADATIHTSNERFNHWLERSAADLHMMITYTDKGPYPYAGVPWFNTVFGRDGIITALEYLWLNPDLAKGVLKFLAATQATTVDPHRDAEPGKILHEMRRGEMATLGEIPFGRYYGSVDATPLFVLLAGAYYRQTGDLEFIRSIWNNIERALAWIDEYGDADGDGFIDYVKKSPKGLTTQGWKDSVDSVFHADGTLAEAPIALCEVQGYVYGAWRTAAELAEGLGDSVRSRQYTDDAERLRQRFEEAFWCEDLGTYALALDAHKRPCRVRTSNAGQTLFTGIASAARAKRVADTLMDTTSFSGWGVRTVASTEIRFNPMSYHNGSIWPHDNALIALGFARYGLQHHAQTLLSSMFEAGLYMELRRMPELFCGFKRREHEGPTLYPVACAPQAWAAASVFLLLQACLGLSVDAPRGHIRLFRPSLPESIDSLRIEKLRAGDAEVDLDIVRRAGDVGVSINRRVGNVEVVTYK